MYSCQSPPESANYRPLVVILHSFDLSRESAGPHARIVSRLSNLSSLARRWPRSAHHARTHAVLAALILWIAALVIAAAGAGNRSIAGPLKGADFAHFYTIGWLARTHHVDALYDVATQHAAQVALIPESDPELYLPVYPPHTALVFAPFTVFSFGRATLLWNLVTILGFAAIVWSAWRSVASSLSDRALVVAAAAAFPPFWSLILHGQTTILIVAALWAGWRALERQRPFAAGVAFGLLFLKPQLGIPLAVVVLAHREWAMLGGAVASIAAQLAVAAVLLGPSVISAYATFLPTAMHHAELLDPKPWQSHSLHTLTRLAPSWIGTPLWIALAGAITIVAARTWASRAPIRVRLGLVILASVLVSPHLNAYDATVLALPLIWLGGYVNSRNDAGDRDWFWRSVYWLFVALLAPSAAAIGLQISVVLLIWLFVRMARIASRDDAVMPMSARHDYMLDRMPSAASFSATSLPTR